MRRNKESGDNSGQQRQRNDQGQGQRQQGQGQRQQGQGQRQQGQGQQQRQEPQQKPPRQNPPKAAGRKSQPKPPSEQSSPGPSQLPPKVTPSELAVCFEAKASISPKIAQALIERIPKRRNPMVAGTQGRPIKVEANMMSIAFGKKFSDTAVHYDAAINPDLPKCLLPHVMEEVRKQHYPKRYPAFDGRKNLFSSMTLPFGDELETSVQVPNSDGRAKEFKVKLTKVNVIDMAWLKNVRAGLRDNERESISIQVLDIILRAAPSCRAINVGRSFFTPPEGRVVDLGEGLELWVGTFQSAVMGWKPFLNIDVAHKGFPKEQSVMDAMRELATHPRDDPRNTDLNSVMRKRADVVKFLKGLQVRFEIPGYPNSRRTWKIVELAQPAGQNKFTLTKPDTGQEIIMTVEKYFLLEKKYKLKYPDWPCLWVQPKEKNIFVPVELCTIISGQARNKKLTENQTAKMVREAATATNIRKDKIFNGFSKMRYNENPTMREFDVNVNDKFEVVDARVLNAPKLEYGSAREQMVNKGIWPASQFLSPSQGMGANAWTIVSLDRYINDQQMQTLFQELQKEGRKLGMNIGEPRRPYGSVEVQRNPQVTLRALEQYFDSIKKLGIKFVVVVIPDKMPAYEIVKQCSELRVGILTSCLKAQTVTRKLNQATVNNILQKFNAKLNGTNHSFAKSFRPVCLAVPCMIVGADVTHPSPDAIDKPSIAAVAASHDPKAFGYNVEIRLQPPKTEMISDLEQIMCNQLKFFFRKTGLKPLKIVFYRDGVSEGQFPQVMHHEIEAIRKACTKLQADYKPQITFVVVQKRHHIRFFPTHKNNSDDRNFNVQAGTIVDTMITHPEHIDFYLVSHASIQGTARPTKYRCLWDDSNMTEDQIESLTYYLCHMFSRCTRSVSYPAPTYYAHLAAFRARALTHEVPIALDRLPAEQQNKLTIKTEVLKDQPMFFV